MVSRFEQQVYKTGISTVDGLRRTQTWLGTTRNISYSLLRVGAYPQCADLARFEQVIKIVRLSSGSCRTTYAGRFKDLDDLTISILNRKYPSDYALSVHDVGTSDGFALSEWALPILRNWGASTVVGSDYRLHLIEARRSDSEAVIFEPDGTPIQYVRPPFVVALAYPEKPIYVLNRVMSWWGRKKAGLISDVARGVSWPSMFDTSVQRNSGWTFESICLLHPRVISLMRSSPRFRIVEHDALTQLSEPCDVLRALNVFNRGVLTESKIQNAIRSAFQSLKDGGMFIVGRTIEGGQSRNEVSVFVKGVGRFSVLARIGRGSELEPIVLGLIA